MNTRFGAVLIVFGVLGLALVFTSCATRPPTMPANTAVATLQPTTIALPPSVTPVLPPASVVPATATLPPTGTKVPPTETTLPRATLTFAQATVTQAATVAPTIAATLPATVTTSEVTTPTIEVGAPVTETATSDSSTTVAAEMCLACHGPFKELASKTENYVWLDGTTNTPHRYLPHDSENLPDCTLCHKPHPLPPTASDIAALKDADGKWCYGCHHAQVLTCGTCHEE